MRRIGVILLLCFLMFRATAQVGNEWIQFNQQYFKIPVAKDGLYKLTAASLQAAGLPATVDPRTLRLFHRGTEQAINVQGQSDGILNATDYLEFYGRHNDGTLDTKLYKTGTQPHALYNLYNDTTSYFLTYGSVTGKRITLSMVSNTGQPVETFHWDEKLTILSTHYSPGIDYGNIINSAFENGEGWMGPQINLNGTGSYTIEGITQGVVAGGVPPPELEILLTGRGNMSHAVEIYAGSRLLSTVTFTGYASFKQTIDLQWTDISGDGKVIIQAKVKGVSGLPDRVSVNYIRIRYPQQTDLASGSEKFFFLDKAPIGKSYIELKNPAPGTRIYDVTDPANVLQISMTQTTTLNGIVSGTNVTRKLYAVVTPLTPTIKRVSFRQINPASHNYVIITHPSLRKPASGYTDPVKAYAEYRALPQGGGYDTLIVNIQQLFDQFSYGEQTPLAIFNFLKFLKSIKAPKYLLLIGKGLEVNHNYYRNPSGFSLYKDLVPTAGYPGSDMLYSAESEVATISTGRISASGPQDVAAYLNKVKEHEALPYNDLRRKNVLHLSGGINAGEPQTFREYLEGFAGIAKGYQYGANVKAIAKKSTDIEVINVADEVNTGVNQITFFGHSATESADFDIGMVTDQVMGYDNKGKYPLILMNGCSAGSFFLYNSIFGENWTNTPNRGAIAVIAHSSFGFAFALQHYSSLFYEIGYQNSAFSSSGYGDIQKEIAARYFVTNGVSPVTITQVQQMILLGDPSVKLFGAPHPDYAIQPGTLSIQSIDDEPVTALSDSFKIDFVVHNYGKAIDHDFVVEVTRTLNNNSTMVYDSTFKGILYSDTISFKLPGKIPNGFGHNTFTIKVDALDAIEELLENNNTASVEFFIPLSSTKNLYPQDFAIVNSLQTNLTFQHTDQLSGEQEFLVEMDTVPTFTSEFKKAFTVKATVLATQAVTLLTQDSLAYYWRTKLANPSAEESAEWDMNSFTYIFNGSPGWAQVHFPQYDQNPSEGLVKDPLLREIRFEESVIDVSFKTFGSAAGQTNQAVSVKIKGAEYNLYGGGSFECRNNTLNLIAFDKKTAQPYLGIYLTYLDIQHYGGKNYICGREPYVINSFLPTELVTGNGVDLIVYVDNIPAGDSVVLFNIGDAGYGTWPQAAKDKLAELGISSAQVSSFLAGEPIVIFGRKGSVPGTARVVRTAATPANQQELLVDGTMTGRFTSGSMSTGLIGPARQWGGFDVRYSEPESTDETFFDVYGVRLNGEEDILKADLQADEDLSTINAAEYPYLRIVFRPSDNTFVTPAQLDQWIVTYQPVAEGMLLYSGPREQQSVFEGQTWQGEYSFVNISNETFSDSLTVRYEVKNPATFVSSTTTMKVQAPAPGDTTHFSIPVSTITHDGLNDVEVFVNPRVIPEISYDNNLIVLSDYLDVIADASDPVLDITVDGRHIFRDEYISPTPDIRVMLWDNNPYLLRKDTVDIMLFITDGCAGEDDCDFKRIYFSSPEITWHPETDTSEFYISFKPSALADGRYTLRATGKDENGNASGATPYEIIFQVMGETTLTTSPAYPNPFVNEVNFEFTLTGQQLPAAFGLDILSTSGRPVFRFTQDDISQFHIGTNIITWKATDTYGNALPNGIYIYRMTIKLSDEKVATRIGKVVLVR